MIPCETCLKFYIQVSNINWWYVKLQFVLKYHLQTNSELVIPLNIVTRVITLTLTFELYQVLFKLLCLVWWCDSDEDDDGGYVDDDGDYRGGGAHKISLLEMVVRRIGTIFSKRDCYLLSGNPYFKLPMFIYVTSENL